MGEKEKEKGEEKALGKGEEKGVKKGRTCDPFWAFLIAGLQRGLQSCLLQPYNAILQQR